MSEITVMVPSSREGHEGYLMRRSESGRWEHADLGCESWQYHPGDRCKHIERAEQMEDRSLTVRQESPLALMQAIDIREIVGTDLIVPDLDERGEHPWLYEFPDKDRGGNVRGLTAKGIDDACRALSSKGEIIQGMECHLEAQDDKEAYFIAKAGRFAISRDGEHIGPLDTHIAAFRQPKYEPRRNGQGDYFVKKWFEVGTRKALRNAMSYLIPESMKQRMIAIAVDAKKGGPSGRKQKDETTRVEEPLEGDYRDIPAGLTYRQMKADARTHATALNGFLKELGKVGQRMVPDDMMDLPPDEILRRLSGGA